MGIMDTVTGMFGGKGDTTMSTLKGLAEFVNQSGGINGLVEKFQTGGTAEIVKSWISTGQNLPISSDQIQAVLGSETVTNLAAKTGMTPDELKNKLTEVLPTVIDKLSPNGHLDVKNLDFKQILSLGTDLLAKK